ncbi:hypothetical protein TNCV_1023391 [Trichonephila clavipes]|nr:hypothetical protein TNCV_1023391 [Trichonephila clavipes]
MWSRRKAVAEFRLTTWTRLSPQTSSSNSCVAQALSCTLCNIWKDMDADHIRCCLALKGSSLRDLYWQARDLLGS